MRLTSNPKIIYTALFVDDPAELIKMFPPKHPKIFAHHSTNQFRPKDTGDLEIGKKSRIKILGRASDEKGDVLLVENSKSENKHPHITLSCTEGVSPVYSQELLERSAQNGTVEMFETPLYAAVTEGYYNSEGKNILAV